jgi:hypothetical protein
MKIETMILPDTFVNNDADGMSCHIEHTARLAVIESMRHTFLYSAIALVRTSDSNRIVSRNHFRQTLTSTISPRL